MKQHLSNIWKLKLNLSMNYPHIYRWKLYQLRNFHFYVKIPCQDWKASWNTDLDMQEILGIEKALQFLQGELKERL